MTFDELDLCDDVLDALDAMQFDRCTPIQEQAIPLALEGRDVIAVAQTGTGKTAAFLLPVIDRLANGDYPTDTINCIVMSPTRELAQQIDRQMEGFSYYLPVSSLAITGGTDGAGFAQQQRGLKMGADVVIATPGRLLAHLQMGYVDLSGVSFLILDEADRMLDMGFYDDIMQIVKRLPTDRQTLMFSATMPPKIQKMAQAILRDPAEVKIAVSKPGENIEQSAYVCYEGQKTPILRHLLKHVARERVIVFASSKLKVKELTRELRRAGIKAAEMHSDLDQDRRDRAMLDFRAGRIDILVATDILARGIDIDDIAMVVNYDVPREAEDYVHRIGRTARAGAGGKAVTLVSERDRRRFADIERLLEKEVTKTPLPAELGGGPEYGGSSSGNKKRSGNSRDRRNNRPGRAEKPRKSGRRKPEQPSSTDNATKAPEQNATKAPEPNTNAKAPEQNAEAASGGNAGARRRRNHRGGKSRRRGNRSTPESPSPGNAE